MNDQHTAEQVILGGIIDGGQRAFVEATKDGLHATDFQDWRHRIIFLAAKDLAQRPGEDIDLIALSVELDQNELMGVAGGPKYLHDLLADYVREE